MLKIYHSNRMEQLVSRLADSLQTPATDPFAPEIILVQSNGMRRWVSMELARRLGICANLQFPYPAAFIWKAYQAVLPQVPETSPFAVEMLVWRLLRCFDELEDSPVFAPLQAYLQNADALERYQLACGITATFDQYLVYRPDWINQWEQGAGEHWQAALWRRLVTDNTPHRARLQQAFLKKLKTLKQRPRRIPARLACIGIGSLPAAYLDVLYHLAKLCEIQLYLLNPCRQYWGLIQAEREIARHTTEAEAEALYLETGNRLLASLGRQGRDFHHLVVAIDPDPEELFEAVPEDNLLHCLQADILDLHNRGRNHDVCTFDTLSRAVPTTPLAPRDRSLQVHVCHSALREVEVLYDQLLELFQQHPDLKASEVVVMTPDIETYASGIRAVFGTAEREQRIPFSVADRPLRAESPVADAFLRLLELPGSRFAVNQVTALLEAPVIHQRFGLNEADLPAITDWLRQTAIRWGIDEHNRAALQLPPTAEHSWKAGLERLLLGFALPAEERRLYEQILPFDAMEGEQARIMGRLQRFARHLFGLNALLDGEKTVSEWRRVLQTLLDNFITVSDDYEQERETVRAALDALEDSAGQAEFTRPVPLAVIRAWLTQHLDNDNYRGVEGFLSGGVTFCAMLPMRSIPFRVVCLIGLNNDSYPRPQRPLDFDLLAKYPRRGDRSRRQEDRYLFLEALLSAREVLYLSYVGSSIRDNSVIPPSVLVSELLDYIRQGFYPANAPDGDPLSLIVTRHPLQAFSRRYFEVHAPEQGLFSYSQLLCAAAREQGQGNRGSRPLFLHDLPEPEAEYRNLDFQDLIRFFQHPTRYLLQNRLKVRLREGEEVLETREPFLLERFADSAIREELLTLQLEGQTPGEILPIIRAKGLLPHGQIGDSLYGREVRRVKPLLKFHEQTAGQVIRKLEVDLTLAGFHLGGWLGNVSSEGLFDIDVNPLQARHYLDLWIRHLLLNCLQPEGVTQVSSRQGLDGCLVLLPVAEPEVILQDLLTLYWQGLQKPLHFFPKSSLAYMEADEKQDPLKQARQRWEGSDNQWGESMNSYYQVVFRNRQPLDAEFIALSQRIFGPLLAQRGELS